MPRTTFAELPLPYRVFLGGMRSAFGESAAGGCTFSAAFDRLLGAGLPYEAKHVEQVATNLIAGGVITEPDRYGFYRLTPRGAELLQSRMEAVAPPAIVPELPSREELLSQG
jgi:hypothetical protein